MPDATPTLLYNPRCSKCREALSLLRERGVEPEIVEYLKTPPSAGELGAILDKLGLEPRELMRTQEPEYRRLGLDDPALSRERLIEAMVENPRLIERPIAITDGQAVIGRPPVKVLDLL